MSALVLDSSVIIKWFVPEERSAEARRWRSVAGEIHAPDFLYVEVANVLWKKVERADLAPPDARAILDAIFVLPIDIHATSILVSGAYDLAIQTHRSVYDCLYLALAIKLGGQMVTADRRLVNALATTAHARYVHWVEDTP